MSLSNPFPAQWQAFFPNLALALVYSEPVELRPIRESQRDAKHKNEAFSILLDGEAIASESDGNIKPHHPH